MLGIQKESHRLLVLFLWGKLMGREPMSSENNLILLLVLSIEKTSCRRKEWGHCLPITLLWLNCIRTKEPHTGRFCGSVMEDRERHTSLLRRRLWVSLHNHLELGVCLGWAVVPLTEECFSASKNPVSVGSAGVALSSLTSHLGSIRPAWKHAARNKKDRLSSQRRGTSLFVYSRHTDKPRTC